MELLHIIACARQCVLVMSAVDKQAMGTYPPVFHKAPSRMLSSSHKVKKSYRLLRR